ncbi:MAG: hypothetical protein K0R54_1511 [Clostridiaceae bacterium]|jgi:DNA-binding FrmR family transcriptional regulator|nr:hypothetical protein [Clostridiaceae bacterium]
MEEKQKSAFQILVNSREQIEEIIKMLNEETYYVYISNKIIETETLLRKADLILLNEYLHNYVKNVSKSDGEGKKLEEIIELLSNKMS